MHKVEAVHAKVHYVDGKGVEQVKTPHDPPFELTDEQFKELGPDGLKAVRAPKKKITPAESVDTAADTAVSQTTKPVAKS